MLLQKRLHISESVESADEGKFPQKEAFLSNFCLFMTKTKTITERPGFEPGVGVYTPTTV